MNVEIRNDGSITVEGYVNAVDRYSKPLYGSTGKFIERVEPNTFTRSLEKNANVDMLLNHDNRRKLADTQAGTLELREDAIGLYAKATINDKEVIEEHRAGNLKGWSFGFKDNNVTIDTGKDGVQYRTLNDIDLFEVSLLTIEPAYIGTSVQARSNEIEMRHVADTVEVNKKQDVSNDEKREFVNYDALKAQIDLLNL